MGEGVDSTQLLLLLFFLLAKLTVKTGAYMRKKT